MQEFKFNYLTSKTQANIDDFTLNLKIGHLVKKNIELQSIQYFMVKEYDDYKELIVRYLKPNRKSSNVRLLCGYGGDDFDNLVAFLAQKFPAKDLRKMDSNEAMKLMKAANTQKIALVFVVLLIPALMLIFLMPGLVHYFDNGHENATIEQVKAGKEFSTHNLTLEGTVLNNGMWEETTSSNHGNTTKTERNYFPLVAKSWQKGSPVFVLLKAGKMTQVETDEFVYQTSFTGTTRTVMWEGGISDEQLEFFNKEYGITFNENAMVFEIIEGKVDGYVIWVFGGIMVIDLFIFFILLRKFKKNN